MGRVFQLERSRIIDRASKLVFHQIGDLAHLGERQTEAILLSQLVQWLSHCLSAIWRHCVRSTEFSIILPFFAMLLLRTPWQASLVRVYILIMYLDEFGVARVCQVLWGN